MNAANQAGLLSGKVCIVTGAAGGIGKARACLMAAEGAHVVIADIEAAAAEAVAREISSDAPRAVSCGVDISDESQVVQMVELAVQEFGVVHVLHNNAALTSIDWISRDGRVADLDVEVWDRTMAVNVRGAMLCTKHVIPRMLDAGTGSIINASSSAGLAGKLGTTSYGCSKAAVAMLTQYVATQYGKQGIRCNAIAPGLILSEMAKDAMLPEAIEMALENTPSPRVGTPEDIARLTVFLASDQAEYINGQVIRCDGGFLSHDPLYAPLLKLGVHHIRQPDASSATP